MGPYLTGAYSRAALKFQIKIFLLVNYFCDGKFSLINGCFFFPSSIKHSETLKQVQSHAWVGAYSEIVALGWGLIQGVGRFEDQRYLNKQYIMKRESYLYDSEQYTLC